MATNPPSPRPLALVTGAFAGIGRALVEYHQVDLALLEHAGGLDEVSPGAPEPVELGDHQRVPGAECPAVPGQARVAGRAGRRPSRQPPARGRPARPATRA